MDRTNRLDHLIAEVWAAVVMVETMIKMYLVRNFNVIYFHSSRTSFFLSLCHFSRHFLCTSPNFFVLLSQWVEFDGNV